MLATLILLTIFQCQSNNDLQDEIQKEQIINDDLLFLYSLYFILFSDHRPGPKCSVEESEGINVDWPLLNIDESGDYTLTVSDYVRGGYSWGARAVIEVYVESSGAVLTIAPSPNYYHVYIGECPIEYDREEAKEEIDYAASAGVNVSSKELKFQKSGWYIIKVSDILEEGEESLEHSITFNRQ